MLKNVKNGAFHNVYNYWGDRSEMESLNVSILWPGGGSSPPLGRPVCGFDNEFCPEAAKGIKKNIYCTRNIHEKITRF